MLRKRPPTLLWANVYCLLDTSSGASLAVREMLRQLQRCGWDIRILGATNFDSERGAAALSDQWPQVERQCGRIIEVHDGELTHHLYVTASTERNDMTNREAGQWFALYEEALEEYRPDVVFFYGGQPLDLLIAREAKCHDIPVAFYLANGNYARRRWAQDIDLILTDSRATADMYKTRYDLDATPVGAFIDPTRIVAPAHSRERVLFVNPIPAKGATLVARLAMLMERSRPDIAFEVVEARGSWSAIADMVQRKHGADERTLANVIVTPTTDDMRPVYGRARLLLAPSLWWESSGRVLVEAMLNGIPVVCTNRGGMPEMVQDGGILVNLPGRYYEPPYTAVPDDAEIAPFAKLIEALYDDVELYEGLARRAHRVGQEQHDLEANANRLRTALETLLN
jgi:glycosyltransferase involved in cell wall biosynthesis